MNVKDLEVPNAPNVQPQGKVTNINFDKAIWILSQAVIKQVE